jgi:hypothetical protein
MIKNEQSLRFKALECRLRMEEIAFRWILVAAPYLNPEDKSGWKASEPPPVCRRLITSSHATISNALNCA